MSGHTPGPWAVNADYGFVMQQRTRRIVAEVERMGFKGNKAHKKRTLPDLCLIAAAPELLEALIHLEMLAGQPSMSDDPVRVSARAAIAKATGEAT